MADIALKGNGEDCPACELRRLALINEIFIGGRPVPCNFCGGSGRVGRALADIIREAVTWAASNYWPERERRWALENEATPGVDSGDR